MSYKVCIVCGQKLHQHELKVRPRSILTGVGYVRGSTCDMCYETHQMRTPEEILGM